MAALVKHPLFRKRKMLWSRDWLRDTNGKLSRNLSCLFKAVLSMSCQEVSEYASNSLRSRGLSITKSMLCGVSSTILHDETSNARKKYTLLHGALRLAFGFSQRTQALQRQRKTPHTKPRCQQHRRSRSRIQVFISASIPLWSTGPMVHCSLSTMPIARTSKCSGKSVSTLAVMSSDRRSSKRMKKSRTCIYR
jgi:hypothetical protein